MGASITLAGESLIAQKQGAQLPLIVSRFVLANVPGLNPTGPVNRAAGKPPAAQIVGTYDVTQKGFVNPNQVVYSLMLGSDVGDFDWNWIGMETDDNVLLAVAYVPLQQKRKNIPPLQLGNNVTRNFLMVFDGAQALTGITIDAKTWQHDFTVRLGGIDERERLSNRDIYGPACFFGTAWQVEKVGSAYQVKPGQAYVEGVRLISTAATAVTVPALPTTVWLDVALERQLSDVVAQWSVVCAANKTDYTDSAGTRHFCIRLADLTASAITDRRSVEPINSSLLQYLAARNGDYANLRARATTKDDVGLSNVPNAISDDASTNNSLIIASTKAVKSAAVAIWTAVGAVDERERQSNRDVFGRACFFGSSLQLEKVGSVFRLKPGTAYAEGIRLVCSVALPIVPPSFPTTAWLDVALPADGSNAAGGWQVVFGANKADYTDGAGVRHYCVAIADLASATVFTDRRSVEAIDGPLVAYLAARNGDYPNLRARATTKDDVGLSNLPNAKTDNPKTNDSNVLATSKALYTHIDACLEDIPDISRARAALKLKSAALIDKTESSTDSTPGRALQTGDFGCGATTHVYPPGNNIDATDIPSGSYRYDNYIKGDRPGSGIGTLHVSRIGKVEHTQLAIDYLDGCLYFRVFALEAFGKWTGLSASSQLPIGVPLPWPLQVPPANYLVMVGQAFSPSAYPALAVMYPTNRLPDMRAEFIRGWDAGRGIDSARELGSLQLDALQNITGAFGGAENSASTTGAFADGTRFGSVGPGNNPRHVTTFDASRVARTATETRPRNIAFNYICRAK